MFYGPGLSSRPENRPDIGRIWPHAAGMPPLPRIRRLLAGGAALAVLVSGSGCAGTRAKAGLFDAYYRNQAGDNAAALAQIERTLRLCDRPGVPGYVVVEACDDAGYNYFINGRPQEAFVHQAAAVLLADVYPTPPELRAAYVERLLRALRGTDLGLDPDAIRADHHVLLDLPGVRNHPLIRRHFPRMPAH